MIGIYSVSCFFKKMRKSYIELDSDEEIDSNPIHIKAYVIGANRSGKTSFIKRILFNTFTFYYTQTKSIEIYKKIIYKPYSLSDSYRPKINIEFWDIPPNYKINKIHINDILIVVFKDKMPQLPNIPIRTWLLYRDKKPNNFTCVNEIKIDNLENTGIKTFVKSVLNEFTIKYH